MADIPIFMEGTVHIQLTSGRDTHDYDHSHNSCIGFSGRDSNLASQSQLGILPKRWLRTHRADSYCSLAASRDLTGL
jgi:hypothetical protein